MRTMVAGTLLVVLGGCDCPNPITVTNVITSCDERTRTCTTSDETLTYCPCEGAECGGDPHFVHENPCEPLSGLGEWVENEPSPNLHVIDGAFTGQEWQSTTRLEGLFTDVYLDYREGRLYFLNDWRSNDEGIRPDCFNLFKIRVGEDWIDLRVYGSGEVAVTRNGFDISDNVTGAYGFGPSPEQAIPHTIWEFSLRVEPTQIDICCFDPLTESSCEELAHEPMIVSIDASGSGPRIRRSVPEGSVTRLEEGAACGAREGICEDGLTCMAVDTGGSRCASPAAPPPLPVDPEEPPF